MVYDCGMCPWFEHRRCYDRENNTLGRENVFDSSITFMCLRIIVNHIIRSLVASEFPSLLYLPIRHFEMHPEQLQFDCLTKLLE